MGRWTGIAYFILGGLAMGAPESGFGAAPEAVTTEWVSWAVGADGANAVFADRNTGTDYATPASPGFQVLVNGAWHDANRAVTSATPEGATIQIFFDEADARAVLRIDAGRYYLAVEVVAFEGPEVDQLAFVNIPLTLKDKGESFEACILALNEQTRVEPLPSAMTHLRATAWKRFGIVGARAAVMGCPSGCLRDALKAAIEGEPGLPGNVLGGPFALDEPATRHSYLMDTRATVTSETVEDWIALLGELGIPQLDWHAGVGLRFGDYEPNPALYPGGLAEVRRITDRLHEAGHASGLHTYAFFLAKDTPWVSPVPHPNLLKNATYTLAADLTADATVVTINESTEGRSTLTSFFERNSLTIQIGGELIVYDDFTTAPPYQFIGCQRGALGTTASAHSAGTKAHHLDQLFNLFAPEPGSALWDEVIARTVKVYNEGGFRMMYLDALDGGYILDGPENAWHWEARFVNDLLRGVERPPIMEMSTFHHHLWAARSRIGAWDFPQRGYKTFIDMHVLGNQSQADIFLPAHLGWWGRWDWATPRSERMFLDDMEHLCGQALAYDMSLSLIVGFDTDNYAISGSSRRMGPMIRDYETLRNRNEVPAAIREQLKAPGKEHTLVREADGAWAFHPIHYARHKVTGLPESLAWTVVNPYGEQPAGIRIQAELSAEPPSATAGLLLIGPADAAAFAVDAAAEGVTASVSPEADGQAVILAASNTGLEPHRAWAKFTRRYEPRRNIGETALRLRVTGDGSGAVLNVQLQSPMPYLGGYVNYHVPLDFTGERVLELVEPESDATFDYDWPYAAHRSRWPEKGAGLVQDAYTALFFPFEPDRLEWVNLWLNNIPEGGTATCTIHDLRTAAFAEVELRNPVLTVNGQRIVFPCALPAGHYLEIRPGGVGEVLNKAMDRIAEVTPQGELPILASGVNAIRFECENPGAVSARATVTVISRGEGLRFGEP